MRWCRRSPRPKRAAESADAPGLRLRPERNHPNPAGLPTGEGAGFEFNATKKALEPFRDRTLVLSNLAQINGRSLGDGGGDHARAGATWLTGVHPKKTEGADIHAGISADQIAAREFGEAHAVRVARNRRGSAEPGRRLRFRL